MAYVISGLAAGYSLPLEALNKGFTYTTRGASPSAKVTRTFVSRGAAPWLTFRTTFGTHPRSSPSYLLAREALNKNLNYVMVFGAGSGGAAAPKEGQLWPRGQNVNISRALTVTVTQKEVLDGGSP